jgi:hypothetical protein
MNYESLSERSKQVIMKAMGHDQYCDMDPDTHEGCTCDASKARSVFDPECRKPHFFDDCECM